MSETTNLSPVVMWINIAPMLIILHRPVLLFESAELCKKVRRPAAPIVSAPMVSTVTPHQKIALARIQILDSCRRTDRLIFNPRMT